MPWPYLNVDTVMEFASLVRQFGQADRHVSAHQQIAHWYKYLGWKFGRWDVKANREIIGVYHDLQHAGEQEIAPAQGPALPGNQYDVTCSATRE